MQSFRKNKSEKQDQYGKRESKIGNCQGANVLRSEEIGQRHE